jgi:hypothetical protein
MALLVVLIQVGLRHQSEWEEVYLKAAQHLRERADAYRVEDGYLYPPFTAWAAQPLVSLPHEMQRGFWLVLNGFCLWFLVTAAWKVAGGDRLQGSTKGPREEYLAAALGLLCGVFYLHNCLVHHQTDVLIGALLLGGCLALVRGRFLIGATGFGLAAAMKCTALLWAPYLLWRGRPLVAVWVVIVALGVNFLPDLTNPSPTGRSWLLTYGSRFLQPLTEPTHYPGTWGSELIYNQSLSGAATRWLTTSWEWDEKDCVIRPRSQSSEPGVVRKLVYSFEALLLVLILGASGRPFRQPLEGQDRGPSAQALEYGLVLLLMLLLSPMSSKAHFGVLVLPGFCLARAAVAFGGRALWTTLGAAVTCAVLANKDPLGERLYTLTLWYGNVTWNALFLLIGCGIVLWKRRFSDAVSLGEGTFSPEKTARAA